MSTEVLPAGAMPRSLNNSRWGGGRSYVSASIVCARPCSAPVHSTLNGVGNGYTHVCDKGHRWHRDRLGKWTAKS